MLEEKYSVVVCTCMTRRYRSRGRIFSANKACSHIAHERKGIHSFRIDDTPDTGMNESPNNSKGVEWLNALFVVCLQEDIDENYMIGALVCQPSCQKRRRRGRKKKEEEEEEEIADNK